MKLADDERARPGKHPRGSDAMKAVLTNGRFSDPAWIFERKLDGIRCISVRSSDRTEMLPGNDLPLNQRFPEIADALDDERCGHFAVDGEIVAFEGTRTSFAALTRRD